MYSVAKENKIIIFFKNKHRKTPPRNQEQKFNNYKTPIKNSKNNKIK